MNPYKAKLLRRWDVLGAVFLLLSTCVFVIGIAKIQTNTEDVSQWLPDFSSGRETYEFFRANFGSDDFLVVTWKDCVMDDPRIGQFANYVSDNDPDQLVKSVRSGADVVRHLVKNARITRKTAKRRMKGYFFGLNDTDLTCVIVELTEQGTANRPQVIELTWEAVDHVEGLDRKHVSLGGYPFVATVLDQQIKGSFQNLIFPSCVIATFFSMLCLRNFRLVLIVFVVSSFAGLVSVAFVPICGEKYGGLASIIPTLAYVLTTSGSLHLIRYNLDSIGDPFKLLAVGWKPCLISTTTTAIGMLTLMRSEFPAIRHFGFFCAAGVMFSLAFQLIITPWLLTRVGQPGLRGLKQQDSKSSSWPLFLHGVRKHHLKLVVIGMIMAGVSIYGLTRLRAWVEVEGLFTDQSPIMQSIRDLEERLGPMDQTEVILVFDSVDVDTFNERARFVRGLQSRYEKLDKVQIAHSLLNYLPIEPRGGTARSVARRTIYRRLLSENRDLMANGLFLKVNGMQEVWRVTIRFPFTEEVDFEIVQSSITKTTDEFFEEYQQFDTEFELPKFLYTGKLLLYQQAQKTLLQDLLKNFLLAFAIITPLLIIVLRSVPIGLIAMIPNMFPILIVFGGLGLMNLTVDTAIAMTASVALGIAVDDTTHFLIRFRDFGGDLNNVSKPLRNAIRQCGPAMLHTTLITGSAIGVYYFSELLVMARFASAISVLLVIALLADVILLPAILFLADRGRNPASSKAKIN